MSIQSWPSKSRRTTEDTSTSQPQHDRQQQPSGRGNDVPPHQGMRRFRSDDDTSDSDDDETSEPESRQERPSRSRWPGIEEEDDDDDQGYEPPPMRFSQAFHDRMDALPRSEEDKKYREWVLSLPEGWDYDPDRPIIWKISPIDNGEEEALLRWAATNNFDDSDFGFRRMPARSEFEYEFRLDLIIYMQNLRDEQELDQVIELLNLGESDSVAAAASTKQLTEFGSCLLDLLQRYLPVEDPSRFAAVNELAGAMEGWNVTTERMAAEGQTQHARQRPARNVGRRNVMIELDTGEKVTVLPVNFLDVTLPPIRRFLRQKASSRSASGANPNVNSTEGRSQDTVGPGRTAEGGGDRNPPAGRPAEIAPGSGSQTDVQPAPSSSLAPGPSTGQSTNAALEGDEQTSQLAPAPATGQSTHAAVEGDEQTSLPAPGSIQPEALGHFDLRPEDLYDQQQPSSIQPQAQSHLDQLQQPYGEHTQQQAPEQHQLQQTVERDAESQLDDQQQQQAPEQHLLQQTVEGDAQSQLENQQQPSFIQPEAQTHSDQHQLQQPYGEHTQQQAQTHLDQHQLQHPYGEHTQQQAPEQHQLQQTVERDAQSDLDDQQQLSFIQPEAQTHLDQHQLQQPYGEHTQQQAPEQHQLQQTVERDAQSQLDDQQQLSFIQPEAQTHLDQHQLQQTYGESFIQPEAQGSLDQHQLQRTMDENVQSQLHYQYTQQIHTYQHQQQHALTHQLNEDYQRYASAGSGDVPLTYQQAYASGIRYAAAAELAAIGTDQSYEHQQFHQYQPGPSVLSLANTQVQPHPNGEQMSFSSIAPVVTDTYYHQPGNQDQQTHPAHQYDDEQMISPSDMSTASPNPYLSVTMGTSDENSEQLNVPLPETAEDAGMPVDAQVMSVESNSSRINIGTNSGNDGRNEEPTAVSRDAYPPPPPVSPVHAPTASSGIAIPPIGEDERVGDHKNAGVDTTAGDATKAGDDHDAASADNARVVHLATPVDHTVIPATVDHGINDGREIQMPAQQESVITASSDGRSVFAPQEGQQQNGDVAPSLASGGSFVFPLGQQQQQQPQHNAFTSSSSGVGPSPSSAAGSNFSFTTEQQQQQQMGQFQQPSSAFGPAPAGLSPFSSAFAQGSPFSTAFSQLNSSSPFAGPSIQLPLSTSFPTSTSSAPAIQPPSAFPVPTSAATTAWPGVGQGGAQAVDAQAGAESVHGIIESSTFPAAAMAPSPPSAFSAFGQSAPPSTAFSQLPSSQIAGPSSQPSPFARSFTDVSFAPTVQSGMGSIARPQEDKGGGRAEEGGVEPGHKVTRSSTSSVASTPPSQPLAAASLPPASMAAEMGSIGTTGDSSRFGREDTPIIGQAASKDDVEARRRRFEGGGNVETTRRNVTTRKQRFQEATHLPGNRYMELRATRDAQRDQFIKQGLISAPDVQTRLQDAVRFKGLCEDMCPEFEREEREYQKQVDPLEMIPGTRRIDPARAVTAYHRPAANMPQPLPTDVRTPKALKRTVDYLFNTLLSADPSDGRLAETHPFIRDRARQVRQEFEMQGLKNTLLCLDVYERMARWNILCLHWLGGSRKGTAWNEHQEMELTKKILLDLNEMYDRLRLVHPDWSAALRNEPEFRAYHLLIHIRDPEVLRQTLQLPVEVKNSPAVQTVLKLRKLASRQRRRWYSRTAKKAFSDEEGLSFYFDFFKLVGSKEVPYLMACLAELQFERLRNVALSALIESVHPTNKSLPREWMKEYVPLEVVARTLGTDTIRQAAKEIKAHGLQVEWTKTEVGEIKGYAVLESHRAAREKLRAARETPTRRFSCRLVEWKRLGRATQQVIHGEVADTSIIPEDLAAAAASVRTWSGQLIPGADEEDDPGPVTFTNLVSASKHPALQSAPTLAVPATFITSLASAPKPSVLQSAPAAPATFASFVSAPEPSVLQSAPSTSAAPAAFASLMSAPKPSVLQSAPAPPATFASFLSAPEPSVLQSAPSTSAAPAAFASLVSAPKPSVLQSAPTSTAPTTFASLAFAPTASIPQLVPTSVPPLAARTSSAFPPALSVQPPSAPAAEVAFAGRKGEEKTSASAFPLPDVSPMPASSPAPAASLAFVSTAQPTVSLSTPSMTHPPDAPKITIERPATSTAGVESLETPSAAETMSITTPPAARKGPLAKALKAFEETAMTTSADAVADERDRRAAMWPSFNVWRNKAAAAKRKRQVEELMGDVRPLGSKGFKRKGSPVAEESERGSPAGGKKRRQVEEPMKAVQPVASRAFKRKGSPVLEQSEEGRRAGAKKRKSVEMFVDEKMALDLAKTERKHSSLFSRGTYLRALRSRVDSIFSRPSSSQMGGRPTFVVALSVCNPGAPHTWLKRKLADDVASDQPNVRMAQQGRVDLQVKDVKKAADIQLYPDVGLVIFELSPQLSKCTEAEERTRLWEEERERVKGLADAIIGMPSRTYDTSILVVFWPAEDSSLEADLNPASVKVQLGLAPPPRSAMTPGSRRSSASSDEFISTPFVRSVAMRVEAEGRDFDFDRPFQRSIVTLLDRVRLSAWDPTAAVSRTRPFVEGWVV